MTAGGAPPIWLALASLLGGPNRRTVRSSAAVMLKGSDGEADHQQ
jgi:hypothetical protein